MLETIIIMALLLTNSNYIYQFGSFKKVQTREFNISSVDNVSAIYNFPDGSSGPYVCEFIIVRNEISDPSSDPVRECVSFRTLEKGMNQPVRQIGFFSLSKATSPRKIKLDVLRLKINLMSQPIRNWGVG